MADIDTRQRLIDCTLALLAGEGIEAISLRRIARAAGISHGAPLRHFPNLAALLSAVASTGFAEMLLRGDVLPGGTPMERLLAACHSYVDFARAAPALFELMFRRDLLGGAVPLSNAVFEQFRALVAEAQATGWRTSADPRLLAASLWASLRGLVELWGPESSLDTASSLDGVFAVTMDVYER